MLRSVADRWKVVIDYPFDPGHSPHEDLERLERWQSEHGGVQTVCWVPAFLSRPLQLALKRLVIVDHVLGGERLTALEADRDRTKWWTFGGAKGEHRYGVSAR
ncbi:MAG: hypothetical protein ACRDJY_10245 [Thermoleophilaceae bacterium]